MMENLNTKIYISIEMRQTMHNEHKKEGKIKVSTFLNQIKAYKKENIETTAHTFFRLSQKQRKIYTDGELKKVITQNKPLEVVIQKNNNYAVTYQYSNNKYLKIIMSLLPKKVYIVTFYFLNKEQQTLLQK